MKILDTHVHFCPKRVLFGSDWPVCELAGGFAKWLAVAETLAASWSPRRPGKLLFPQRRAGLPAG